jgi:uncharacterized protein YdaU (DUF1376 family)
MAELPYLPIYIDDLHMDTRHLSNEQFGLYVKLLMAAWRDHDNSLPNDPAMICRLVGETGHRKGKIMELVEQFFHVDENRWRQKRLDKTRRKVSRNYRQKVAASRKASEARRLKNNKTRSPAGKSAGGPNQNQTFYKEGGARKNARGDLCILEDGSAVGAATVSAVKNGEPWVRATLSSHKARMMLRAELVTAEELKAAGIEV